MNEKAAELGLESTNYADPSGLLSDNVSSAYDMARLITLASNDERIASVMRMPEYTLYHREAPGDYVPHAPNHLLGCRTSTYARRRPASSPSRVTAWRRCCRCRRAGSRWRWSCWARGRTRGASSRHAISSVAVVEGVDGPRRSAVSPEPSAAAPDPVAIRRNPAASRPHRAAASQSHPQTPSPDEARAGCRTPSGSACRRRTRTPGSVRRAWQTT